MRAFRRTYFPALSVMLLAGLAVALPRVSRGATENAPRIDLDTIKTGPDSATATLSGGGTVRLTLDAGLQHAASRLLARARPTAGAIVAFDVHAGRVLAWAGFRNGRASPGRVPEMLAPAASVFKIVTTAALLEKRVSPNRIVCVEGGDSGISEDNLEVPRTGRALCAPFREALGRSRNAVFAQLATRFLNRDDLIGAAQRFGFGHDAPLDVPATIGSFYAPDGELAFARSAAGFVGSRLSPVGAAYLATTVASYGRVLRVHLRDESTKKAGQRTRRRAHVEYVGRAIKKSTARELRRMMEGTIDSGTSLEAFTGPDGHSYLGDVRAAGKTGTLLTAQGGPMASWFIGFAPSRRPRIALSVLLENGPGWRRKANEVGRDLFRAYFSARHFRGVTAPEGI